MCEFNSNEEVVEAFVFSPAPESLSAGFISLLKSDFVLLINHTNKIMQLNLSYYTFLGNEIRFFFFKIQIHTQEKSCLILFWQNEHVPRQRPQRKEKKKFHQNMQKLYSSALCTNLSYFIKQ